jgi:hypothetical protein
MRAGTATKRKKGERKRQERGQEYDGISRKIRVINKSYYI